MKNILRKALLGLGLVATLGSAAPAKAANIKFETRVAGYTARGNGWVLVLPELRSQLGGRVIWDNARQSYVTDRVSSGETMRISITASKAGEKCQRGAYQGIFGGNGIFTFQAIQLPYVDSRFAVSSSPSFDNVYVYAYTNAGFFDKRIPRGSRPK